jgi:MFS family permease
VGAGVTMLGLGAVNVLFVPLVLRDLGQPATWLGISDAAQTVSMVVAAGLVGVIAARVRPSTPIVVGLGAIALFCLLLSAVREPWQVLALLFAVGWFVTPLNASVATIVQTATDDARRGRVAALLHSVMSLATVLSMAFAGVFGDLLGVRVVFVLAAVLVGLATALAAVLFGVPGRHRPATLATVAVPVEDRAAYRR